MIVYTSRMIWPIFMLIQATNVLCNSENEADTKVLDNASPIKGQHLDIPESTKKLVFLHFNGTLYEDTLSGLNNVAELIFQDSTFSELQPGALCVLPNVKYITLNDIEIDRLSEDSFKNCAGLKNLEIRYRYFTLSPGVFSKLENLESLLFAQFKWGELKKGDFNGLKNVKTISITSGDIEKIEAGTFEDLKQLEELNLRNNHLPAIKGDEFKGLSSLKALNVNYNPTTSINIDELLKNLPALQKLSLSFALVPEADQKVVEEKVKAAGVELSTE